MIRARGSDASNAPCAVRYTKRSRPLHPPSVVYSSFALKLEGGARKPSDIAETRYAEGVKYMVQHSHITLAGSGILTPVFLHGLPQSFRGR